VEACLLVLNFSESQTTKNCNIHTTLDQPYPDRTIGYRNGKVINDIKAYNRWKHLDGDEHYKWRSGIKHDCSKVMEFKEKNGQLINGFDEAVDIEEEYLYPMLKSSDISKPRRMSIVMGLLASQKIIEE